MKKGPSIILSSPEDSRPADPTGADDVVIVGAGPAGLATAIACRLAGLEVTLLDARRPPLDKACGEGLMPDGVAILAELGVGLDDLRSHPFRGIRWCDGGVVAEGSFPGLPGLGIRRLDLHHALQRRAEQSGARILWGRRATALEADGVTTDHGLVRGRWIIGADGLRSKVRRWAGLARESSPRVDGRSRFGVRRHFALAPWCDRVEVHWATSCEAYVTPVAADEVGVAMLWSGSKGGFEDHLECFPALARKLEGAEQRSKDRGAGPFRQKARRVIRRPSDPSEATVALVGDAAGYVDAITGEGLSLAFHQAQALASAIVADDTASYARACRRLARLPDAMTHLLLWVERHPELRRRMIQALAHEPGLFSRLLALHTRAAPIGRSVRTIGPRLAWGMLRV